MSMTTSSGRVAVTEFKSGLTTNHYADLFEMLEQTLSRSGEKLFKDFLSLALPRIIARWKFGREGEAIMEAVTDRLLHEYELLSGCEMIADERARQINREKWTPEHD